MRSQVSSGQCGRVPAVNNDLPLDSENLTVQIYVLCPNFKNYNHPSESTNSDVALGLHWCVSVCWVQALAEHSSFIYTRLQRLTPALASASSSPSNSKQSRSTIIFPLRHLHKAKRREQQTAESVRNFMRTIICRG